MSDEVAGPEDPGRLDRGLRFGQRPERAADERQAEVVGLLGIVTDHVPDAVSIVNRPSRVCQPTPGSRFREQSASVAAFAFGLTPTG